MSGRRNSIWRILGFLTGILVVLFLVLQPWNRPERSFRSSRDKTLPKVRPSESDRTAIPIRSPGTTPAGDSLIRFGILGPAPGSAEWYYPLATALRCVKASGCPCEVVAPPGSDAGSLRSFLEGEEINAATCTFDAALERLNVLLVLDAANLDDVAASRLKAFVATGGWLMLSDNAPLVGQIAEIPAAADTKGNLAWHWTDIIGSCVGRFLVSHPVLPDPPSREWFPIPRFEGKIEGSRPGVGLWLIALRNPSGPGVRVVPVGKGGLVDINWRVFKPCDLNGIESRVILRNLARWLSRKPLWLTPVAMAEKRVSGKVVDEEDAPIAEAEVAARAFADWGIQVEELKTKADLQGNFSLPAIGPSIYWFQASAENMSQEDPFVMARCEEGAEQEPVTIVLRRTVALSGTVYYEARETAPAPDFPVTLLPTDRDPEMEKQTTVSDQQGQFAFEKVPFGKTYLVLSQKGEWGGWKMVELPLDPKEEPKRVVLAIERLPLVYGRVVEQETFEPVPGARVKVREDGGDPTLGLFSDRLIRFEECDEEKGFSFRLIPGRWWVEGMAENYRPAFIPDGGQFKDLSWVRVKAAHGKTDPESPLLLQLARREAGWKRTQFYGVVYLPSGEPAPDAFIKFPYSNVFTSDLQGNYETDPVSCFGVSVVDGVRRYKFAFEVRCQDCVKWEEVLLDGPPDRHRLDIWLERGRAAKGFVRDSQGRPVEGAEVTGFASDDTHKRMTPPVTSAADGSFTLPGVTTKSYADSPIGGSWIHLRAEKMVEVGDERLKYAGSASIRIPEDGPIENFDIIVMRAGMIRGTISYHDGTRLRNDPAGVSVHHVIGDSRDWVAGTHEPPDEHGGFSLEIPGFGQQIDLVSREMGGADWRKPAVVPPDTYELWVEVRDTVDGSVATASKSLVLKDVKAGMMNLDVRFPPMGAIRARVIDAQTGLPVENVSVHARPNRSDWDAWPPAPSWTFQAGHPGPIPNGEVLLLDLIPSDLGTYRFAIWPDEYRDQWFYEVPVAAGQTTDLGDILLYREP